MEALRAPLATLAAALLALAALAAAESGVERLVAVVAVEGAALAPGEESQPLTPLFKVACGNTTVVVYGLEQGRPLLVAVYHRGGGDWRNELPGCLPSLESCLTAAGAAEAYRRLAGMAAGTVLHRVLESRGADEAATAAATTTATAAESPAQAEAGTATAKPQAAGVAAARIAREHTPTLRGAGAALLVLAAAAAAWTVTMAWARRVRL